MARADADPKEVRAKVVGVWGHLAGSGSSLRPQAAEGIWQKADFGDLSEFAFKGSSSFNAIMHSLGHQDWNAPPQVF